MSTTAQNSIYVPYIYRPVEEASTEAAPREPLGGLTDGVQSIQELFRWPPDLFAIISRKLRSSGAYRLAVSPTRLGYGVDLEQDAKAIREGWFEWICNRRQALPPMIAKLQEIVFKSPGLLLDPDSELPDDPEWIKVVLKLYATADMVCEGFGLPSAPYSRWSDIYLSANTLLEVTGSLSRLPKTRGIVLPKMRTAQRGITVRSLSHHMTYHDSEVDVRWRTVPMINPEENTINVLAIPWPFEVSSASFRPLEYPRNRDPEGEFGFFSYQPQTELDINAVLDLYREARREVDRVHIIVFPELALTETDLSRLKAALLMENEAHVPMIIAGLGGHVPGEESEAVFNRVSLSVFFCGQWYSISQDKHHRWMLDAPQIKQYSLASSLNVRRMWWEGIHIPRRALTFMAPNDWLTFCPLICEDLAQLEPVSEVIRGVGPTLVIALLMDGPQLEQRWPGRYVGVLADDPGTSILTLTSLGMACRSRGSGNPERRVIAFWKDQEGGAVPIELDRDARAALLTINAKRKTEYSADGRSCGGTSACLVLQGLRSIHHSKWERSSNDGCGTPQLSGKAEADVEELTVFAYYVDAVIDATAADRDRLRCWLAGREARSSNDAEPFRSIWQQIWRSLWESTARAEKENLRSAITVGTGISREFGAAIDEFHGFLQRFEEPGERPVSLDRWHAMAERAIETLMSLGRSQQHECDEPQIGTIARSRLQSLVNLSVLWAVHIRVQQLMNPQRMGYPELSTHLRGARQLLQLIEHSLEGLARREGSVPTPCSD